MPTLLEALNSFSPEGKENYGICHFVKRFNDYQLVGQLNDLMRQWPEYSGDPVYPIPSFEPDGLSPELKYNCRSYKSKWDRNTAYGAARWRLLDWLKGTLNV